MLTDIHTKFREDIFNVFQVIEWTLFFVMDKVSRVINSESINARVVVLELCLSSNIN